MSEKYKIFDPDKPYFVTFTVVDWIELFCIDKYADIVVNTLKFCQVNKGLELYGYCIMPSHVHLIARSPNNPLGSVVRDVKKYTAVMIIKELISDNNQAYLNIFREAGSRISRNKKYKIWQDGYHPEEISSNKFFIQKLDYIHNNPVEEGLAFLAEKYKYSSARNYAEIDSVLDIILESRNVITYK